MLVTKTSLTFILFLTVLMLCSMVLSQAKPSVTQEPIVLTLDKAIALALQQNRDVLIADQDRDKAEAQVGEAKSGAFPQITISGQYTRNIKKPVLFLPPHNPINPTDETQIFEIGSSNAYQMGAQLSQTLFNKRVGVALQVAKTYRDFTEQGYQATEQHVIREAKKSFYLILLAKKLVEANRQGLEVVKANYENVQAQFSHGTAAEYDLLRAEVQLANTEPILISAENNYQLAVNALKNMLSIPLDQEVIIQGDFTFEDVPPSYLDDFRQKALTNNPVIRQLVLQESLLDKNIKIEKAANFPTLSMMAAYVWQAQDNTYEFSRYNWAKLLNCGVVLSYPLFDGFRTRKRVQEATIDREKVRYTRLKVEEGLQVQIEAAELRMAEAKKRIGGQEKNIEQAQKAMQIAQTRFKSGIGTQLELLDAQVAMTRAQTNYAQAIYDYVVAKTDWHYAVGMDK